MQTYELTFKLYPHCVNLLCLTMLCINSIEITFTLIVIAHAAVGSTHQRRSTDRCSPYNILYATQLLQCA